jgi:hypothetical protein
VALVLMNRQRRVLILCNFLNRRRRHGKREDSVGYGA